MRYFFVRANDANVETTIAISWLPQNRNLFCPLFLPIHVLPSIRLKILGLMVEKSNFIFQNLGVLGFAIARELRRIGTRNPVLAGTGMRSREISKQHQEK